MASKQARNKNAKLLFNPYKASGKENLQGELAIDKYNFIPKSVWHVKKSQKLVDYVNDVIGANSFKDKGKGGKKGETKLSLFNPDVVMRIIKYYTKEGDIIIAPYGSRGVIGIIAYMCGRHSYSCDIVPEYLDEIKNGQKFIKESVGDENTILESFLCDAVTSKVTGVRTVTEQGWEALDKKTKKFKSDFADCIIFNPPYFCLHPMTEIFTKDGVKYIKDIKVGDMVLTHKGRYRKVNSVIEHAHNGIVNEIYTWYNNTPLVVTGNHKIRVVECKRCGYKWGGICRKNCSYNKSKFNCKYNYYKNYKLSWKEAKDLVESDYIVYSVDNTIHDIKYIDLLNYYPINRCNTFDDNYIYTAKNQYGQKIYKRKIEIDEDMMRLFGYFVADGHADKNYISFTLNMKEKRWIISDIKNIMKNKFDIIPRIKKQDNTIHVIYDNMPLVYLFNELFYDSDRKKIIPNWFMNLPLNKQKSYIKGYWWCDGSAIYDNFSMITNSKTLSEQHFHMLLRFGIVCSKGYSEGYESEYNIHNEKDGKIHYYSEIYHLSIFGVEQLEKFDDIVNIEHEYISQGDRNKQQKFFWIDKDNVAIKVRYNYEVDYDSYEVEDNLVYNLEVDEDESYTTYYGCVHNCVEKYKSVDGQLSDISDYNKFLEQYSEAIKQHYRILKPNGFAIAVVNDFRRNDVFYNFHGDTIQLCKEAGFIQHDIIINELNGQAMQSIGTTERLGLKTMPKCHEYILIFRKGSEDGDPKSYREKWKS